MGPKVKTTKRKVGRPTLASLGLPKRERRNFNMQRDAGFDSCLLKVRQIMAEQEGVEVAEVDQTSAVRYAVYMVANRLPVILPGDKEHEL